ncbi:uncharacterized protein N7483_001632 [Penicillium malachiteum]|uniref:uncharacterized protein n=1 Tax=Penicillium malachiteum TaxID=1324776 RepID=UPI0025467E35|nr:uncharacterized protein N7483_001632 [Penicillium malachiteum]KAJ5736507.1 hypothetical protein N7483_001632 [Penicillium malachiteum]
MRLTVINDAILGHEINDAIDTVINDAILGHEIKDTIASMINDVINSIIKNTVLISRAKRCNLNDAISKANDLIRTMRSPDRIM